MRDGSKRPGGGLRGLPPEIQSRRYIGRYEVIYPIAHGGMASVYACRLTGLAGFQRLLAIKIIHPHLSSEKEFIEMFLDEARLSAGIHHPNVGEVLEVGEDNGTYYMVCELILGQDLNTLLRRAAKVGVPVSLELSARIVSLAAVAVHAAHELKSPTGESMNIVHRDISPRNILLTYDGFVKLIDFGVAYARNKISHTDSGTLKGKVRYMSPEQVKSLPVDRRSDVFSLGVVLYEMVTGCSPFVGDSDVERLKKILNYQFEWPANLKLDIPVQLENIIKRAMAYLPEDRYSTAASMSADLEAFIGSSKTVVNSDALSSVMRSLFARERAVHLERIRALEEQPDDVEVPALNSGIPAEATEVMPVRPLSGSNAPGGNTPIRPGTMLLRLARRGRKAKFAVKGALVGVILMALIGLVYFWSMRESGKTPEDAHVRGQAEQPATKINSGAAGQSPDEALTVESELDGNEQDSEIQITIEVHPSEANVKLDGFPVSPRDNILRLTRDGNVHRVQFFMQGYQPQEELVTADGDKRLNVSLSPESALLQHSGELQPQIPSQNNASKNTQRPDSKSGTKRATGKEKASERGKSGAQSDKRSPLLEKSPYQ